jgi:hypothetical protein
MLGGRAERLREPGQLQRGRCRRGKAWSHRQAFEPRQPSKTVERVTAAPAQEIESAY